MSTRIDVRKTNPGLYWAVTVLSVGMIALGVNFLVYTPTFLVYHLPNELWASIFFSLGGARITFLSVWRNLRLMRVAMSLSVAFLVIFSIGTMQPALGHLVGAPFDKPGSLQLPIVYLIAAALERLRLTEPFLNPVTAKQDAL